MTDFSRTFVLSFSFTVIFLLISMISQWQIKLAASQFNIKYHVIFRGWMYPFLAVRWKYANWNCRAFKRSNKYLYYYYYFYTQGSKDLIIIFISFQTTRLKWKKTVLAA